MSGFRTTSPCSRAAGATGRPRPDARPPPGAPPGLLPVDHREAYDATQVLARLVDQSLFWEVMPETGEEMSGGIGRLGGLYAGLVINRQGLVGDPEHPERRRPGGILYRGGIAKLAAFSRACNDDG